jgi:hypothetical protein
MSVYRDRLLKKGIVLCPKYGYLRFTFPRFNEFLRIKDFWFHFTEFCKILKIVRIGYVD